MFAGLQSEGRSSCKECIQKVVTRGAGIHHTQQLNYNTSHCIHYDINTKYKILINMARLLCKPGNNESVKPNQRVLSHHFNTVQKTSF